MAKGITQQQVNAAADALVAAGDKPTVEKIRQALGTGSPNTVVRMLDAWRGTLAQRLREVIQLPDVPPEVRQAFADIWRLAVAQAETLARAALTEEQNALFAAQTSLTQERKLWEIALAEAQANVAESTAKLTQAEVQAHERQALIDQMEAQRTDLFQQRDGLAQQIDQLRRDMERLRAELADVHTHVRTVEDRAHQQVDHARQELKALLLQLERTQRDHAKAMDQATTQKEALQTALRAAEHATAHQAGRVAALETAFQASRQAPAMARAKAVKPSPKPTPSPRRRTKKTR